MRLGLAQCNPHVGDIEGNVERVVEAYRDAVRAGADVVSATELVVTGYPPEDLVLKPAFVEANSAALRRLAERVGTQPLIVGYVELVPAEHGGSWQPPEGVLNDTPPLANSAAVLRDGEVCAVYRKQRLPNYGVFDEARYFHGGHEPVVLDVGGVGVGVTICEDLWGDGGPAADAAAAGAALVINLNASPYYRDKRADREHWASRHATASGIWVAYVNQVGGQDEVVFDGDSFVMSPTGVVAGRGAQFAEDLLLVDLPLEPAGRHATTASRQFDRRGEPCSWTRRLDPDAEVYAALVLGTRDYVSKNGFARALIGLSGGIDSALTAAVAADALGPEHVTGVAMPSPYSSGGSLADAKQLAANLGIDWLELPIEATMEAFGDALAERFAGTEEGVAEENIQSRIRGTLLMALSNKFGDIVLATGNKSEYAVGYSTLYGDMAGGFAVIKDVPKTLVYQLCRWRNAAAEGEGGTLVTVAGRADAPDRVIPQAIIDKEPSAELRPDQRDSDSLPPYEVLDPILDAAIVEHRSIADLVADGHDEELVRRVFTLVDRAEYKRRQSPPGVKITRRAFGKDRRLPITQAWSH